MNETLGDGKTWEGTKWFPVPEEIGHYWLLDCSTSNMQIVQIYDHYDEFFIKSDNICCTLNHLLGHKYPNYLWQKIEKPALPSKVI